MKGSAKVLIVDDDKAICQALSEVVKKMGLKPVVATKPADALNIVKLQSIHAAIIDVLLPKMSGVELAVQFRASKFGDNPIVFVSGVFKDKGFASEAIEKSQAKDFVFKPFQIEELTTSLTAAFKAALATEKWTVQSLVTRRMPTTRERVKALEHLEMFHGNDFPYLLGFLLENSMSGNLNLVNENDEIFGVTLVKGTIAGVDSTESQSASVLSMISNGYLTQKDWDEFQRTGNGRFTLDRLIQDGYVSPHAVVVATHEQILADLKAICSSQSLRLNFSHVISKESPPRHAVTLRELMDSLFADRSEFFNSDYLTQFYSAVLEAPIIIANGHDRLEMRCKEGSFNHKASIRDVVKRSGTIKDALASDPAQAHDIYRGIHYLVLNRDILFDDLERARDLNASLERFQKIYADLRDRSADKVFEYFGAPPMANPKLVETLFEQYVQSNAPDKLPPEATAELKEAAQKCLLILRKAKEQMLSDKDRSSLIQQKKVEESNQQKKIKELSASGLELIKKNQFLDAVGKLKEAQAIHYTNLAFMFLVWAEIKAGLIKDRNVLQELNKKFDSLPKEDRQSAYYFMALGLVKKGLGDPTAPSFFEKAVAADGSFIEARRELAPNPASLKEKKVDILTGDLSQVFSQLFRRKAE